MGKEIWKDIENWPGYEISNRGRCWSNKGPGKYISPHDIHGTLKYNLSNKGKRKFRTIARLVAIAFIPNPLNKPQVHHKDHDNTNNNDWNLEWVTSLEHAQYTKQVRKKFNTREIGRYDEGGRLLESFESLKKAVDKYKLHKVSLWRVLTGKRKKHAGWNWRYL